jgi:hypothetical protein
MPVQFEIHPAIGIARAGNSDQHFVFAGAASENLPRRDGTGKLLRQAAEFRLYRCERDAAGHLVNATELTAANSSIEWTVRVANRKATAIKRFLGGGRRNNATGNDQTDQALIIDSGGQTLSQPNASKQVSGQFGATPVKLGAISMAANGRLLVIGSDGSAGSPAGAAIVHFADNDGWFDAMGDGVIQARVTPNGGAAADALAAWVILAPPDYAPGIPNMVTMYDVLLDLAIARGVRVAPQKILFTHHVRPILERAVGYQWVNAAARQGFSDSLSGGHAAGGPGDFVAQMNSLGDPTRPQAIRDRVFKLLRDPNGVNPQNPNPKKRMPRLNDDQESGGVLPLTRTQYRAMQLWRDGQFDTDAAPSEESEPERLTREALEACAGGPFFPGIEAGLIMQDQSRYMAGEAFRLSPGKVKPGEITQGNAVPWQSDFSACQWDGLLGWWPAQRPDDVLKTANGDPQRWTRSTPDDAAGMLANWHRYGFVKQDPNVAGAFIEQERDPTLPDIGVA